jgi:hypothetical protein
VASILEVESILKMTVFLDVAQCDIIDTDRCYRGDYCFRRQSDYSNLGSKCNEVTGDFGSCKHLKDDCLRGCCDTWYNRY